MQPLVLSPFLLFLAAEPLAVDAPLSADRLKVLDRVVAERQPDWTLEAQRTTPQGVKREWILKGSDSTQGERPRVVIALVSFDSDIKARARLKQARMNTSLSPVQGDLPNGDGCIVWKGYVNPKRRLFQCTLGRVFFTLVSPSEEIGSQFAAGISEGLKASREKL